jgi:hypothetical protein
MRISGAATSSAYRQFSRKMRLCASCKRSHLLMPQVNPPNFSLNAKRIGDLVERVSGDSVSSLNSSLGQNLYEQVSCFFHVFDLHSLELSASPHPTRALSGKERMKDSCGPEMALTMRRIGLLIDAFLA